MCIKPSDAALRIHTVYETVIRFFLSPSSYEFQDLFFRKMWCKYESLEARYLVYALVHAKWQFEPLVIGDIRRLEGRVCQKEHRA